MFHLLAGCRNVSTFYDDILVHSLNSLAIGIKMLVKYYHNTLLLVIKFDKTIVYLDRVPLRAGSGGESEGTSSSKPNLLRVKPAAGKINFPSSP